MGDTTVRRKFRIKPIQTRRIRMFYISYFVTRLLGLWREELVVWRG
jgi:hypothetical protein